MENEIQIVGGERSGERIGWFGNRVCIQGVEHILIRSVFFDGTQREYYVRVGANIDQLRNSSARIEVLG